MYSDEDLLLISGLQHVAFCEKQWALIHMEQEWEENHHGFKPARNASSETEDEAGKEEDK